MNRQKRENFSKKTNLIEGVIHIHPRGFGFINAKGHSELEQDVFIPKSAMGDAVDGDTVQVEIFAGKSEKGPEGIVKCIVKRDRNQVVGIISKAHRKGASYAYAPLLGPKMRIDVISKKEDLPLEFGDRVLLDVIKWGTKDTNTHCQVAKLLGNIEDASLDTVVAVEEFSLQTSFSQKALSEAEKFSKRVSKKDLKGRIDLRNLICFTIDPDTAKDFDDALSIEIDEKGRYHLGVHIADAAYFVRPGTALDEEAQKRLNSTYFPGTCLPMLPPVLSENLLSLRPNVLRLTVSILFIIDQEGETLSYEIKRSVIRSCKRFTYKQAKEVLDGTIKSSLKEKMVQLQNLCFALKKQRTKRGCVEFAIPDLEILINKKGEPLQAEFIPYDITHQMIEECMLKANETIATHLNSQGKRLPYRVHDEPDKMAMKEFSLIANAFGFALPESPSQEDLQALFDEALLTPHGHFLAIRYIRSMRMAQYQPENIGHYGLGLSHYCHFTSPIRRYTDLIIHRLVHNEETGIKDLEEYSIKSNEKERTSQRAEMQVMQLKKLRLLNSWLQKDPKRVYEGSITHIKQFGVFFELKELLIEGFLSKNELSDQPCVTGTKILVQLSSIDFIRLETHWTLKN
jgi:ribonuclease R